LLWLTNVIVFALWYWRLRRRTNLATRKQEIWQHQLSFPEMQVPHDERAQFECHALAPALYDYLFARSPQSSTFGPTDAPLLARWAKVLAMIQVFISLSIVILLISPPSACSD